MFLYLIEALASNVPWFFHPRFYVCHLLTSMIFGLAFATCRKLENKHAESMEIIHLFRHLRNSSLITLLTPLTFTLLIDYTVQTPILVSTAAYKILSLKSRKELSIYLGSAWLALKTAWDLQRKNDFFISVTEIPADSPVYATENNDCWQSQGPPGGLFTFETFEINSV